MPREVDSDHDDYLGNMQTIVEVDCTTVESQRLLGVRFSERV